MNKLQQKALDQISQEAVTIDTYEIYRKVYESIEQFEIKDPARSQILAVLQDSYQHIKDARVKIISWSESLKESNQ